jgi:hypothetical protein
MLHTTYYAAVMFFSIAGPAFPLHLQPLLLLPLHHYAATLRVRVFGYKRAPYFNPLQGPQPCLPAWPVFIFISLSFLHLKRKKKILRYSLGGEREREMCVFQWLFITILNQTRLINQFITFFFLHTMHSRYCQDLLSVHFG